MHAKKKKKHQKRQTHTCAVTSVENVTTVKKKQTRIY